MSVFLRENLCFLRKTVKLVGNKLNPVSDWDDGSFLKVSLFWSALTGRVWSLKISTENLGLITRAHFLWKVMKSFSYFPIHVGPLKSLASFSLSYVNFCSSFQHLVYSLVTGRISRGVWKKPQSFFFFLILSFSVVPVFITQNFSFYLIRLMRLEDTETQCPPWSTFSGWANRHFETQHKVFPFFLTS